MNCVIILSNVVFCFFEYFIIFVTSHDWNLYFLYLVIYLHVSDNDYSSLSFQRNIVHCVCNDTHYHVHNKYNEDESHFYYDYILHWYWKENMSNIYCSHLNVFCVEYVQINISYD